MRQPRPRIPNVQRLIEKERWTSLLRGQLLVYGIKAPELVEEHHFHAVRKFRFDFALPRLKVGIEIEGGVFGARKSRHTQGAGYQRDLVKYNLAAVEGWLVLRYTSRMLETGDAVRQIVQVVRDRQARAGEVAS